MKKISLLILTVLICSFTQAQFVQTDWSGGTGQLVFNNPTMFNYAYHVDYNTSAGDVITDNTSKSHLYGVVEYQGKLLVSTAWSGVFIVDPITEEWEYSHSAPLIYYKNTAVHTDGKLYVLSGYNVFRYDGTHNDYGMGPNGWELHSNLKSLNLNSIYTLESIQGRLLIGCRGGNGISNYTARVIQWNESTGVWQQMGNTFTNGVCSLKEYNGTIYAGTHWAGSVYKWTGSSWVYAFDTRSMSIMDMEVHDGYLYLGGSWDSRWGELYRYNGSTCQTIQYFSGHGIDELESHGDVLTMGLRPKYSSTPSRGIMQYDGNTVSTLYNLNGESYCRKICSYNGDLYYGGISGNVTSLLYKNGDPLQSFYVKGVLSSEFPSVDGVMEYDATISEGNGVKVFIQEKKDAYFQTNTWVEVPEGDLVDVSESSMRYWAVMYTVGEGAGPELHEVRIGASIVVDPLELHLVSQSDVSCFGGQNGAALFNVVGGVEPYTFDFNGQDVNTLENLSAGTYPVTVTDDAGEQVTFVLEINEPEALTLNATSMNVSCYDAQDGSIDLLVTGGVEPYSYLWSHGAQTQDIDGLAAATYSVEVTDANACVEVFEVEIVQPQQLSILLESSYYEQGYHISCNGADDGFIQAVVEGGTQPYLYLWSNGSTTSSITNLLAGSYAVEVIDANGCFVYAELELTQPSPVLADAGEDVLVYFGYDPMSFTELSASGGVSYSWFPTTGLSNPDIANPVASPEEPTVYTVTVTDEYGCSASDDVFVDVMDVRCGKKMNKVLVCHKGKKTLCISHNAVQAHLDHGDQLGACSDQAIISPFDEEDHNLVHVDAYPNPFTNECYINVDLHEKSDILIQVIDLKGMFVKDIFEGKLDAGTRTFKWESSVKNLPGLYLIRIVHNDGVEIIRAIKN